MWYLVFCFQLFLLGMLQFEQTTVRWYIYQYRAVVVENGKSDRLYLKRALTHLVLFTFLYSTFSEGGHLGHTSAYGRAPTGGSLGPCRTLSHALQPRRRRAGCPSVRAPTPDDVRPYYIQPSAGGAIQVVPALMGALPRRGPWDPIAHRRAV